MQQRQEQPYEDQYVHLFPQDGMRFQNSQGNQKRWKKKQRRRRREKLLSWRNLFALIGLVTVIVQAARYIVIPLLVYLNSLAGGAL